MPPRAKRNAGNHTDFVAPPLTVDLSGNYSAPPAAGQRTITMTGVAVGTAVGSGVADVEGDLKLNGQTSSEDLLVVIDATGAPLFDEPLQV
jgi:hypothetical protein